MDELTPEQAELFNKLLNEHKDILKTMADEGKPKLRLLIPRTPELDAAIYNATYKDSFLDIWTVNDIKQSHDTKG